MDENVQTRMCLVPRLRNDRTSRTGDPSLDQPLKRTADAFPSGISEPIRVRTNTPENRRLECTTATGDTTILRFLIELKLLIQQLEPLAKVYLSRVASA